MSNTAIRILFAFGGIISVIWSVDHTAKMEETARTVASQQIAASKEKFLRQRQALRHTEKVRGPITTDITRVSSVSNQHEQVYVLQANVTAFKMIASTKLEWLIPPGVEVINGPVQTVVPEISPERPFRTQITVRQKDDQNRQIHFVASGMEPGLRYSSVSQFNTSADEFLKSQRALVLKSLPDTPQKKAFRLFH